MSKGLQEFVQYMVAGLGTVVGLLALQQFVISYLDMGIAAEIAAAEANPGVQSLRSAEAQRLSAGKMPVEEAMKALAQRGRTGLREITPRVSDDLSAVAGWMQAPGFKPATPFVVPEPELPVPVQPVGGDTPEAAQGGAPTAVPTRGVTVLKRGTTGPARSAPVRVQQ